MSENSQLEDVKIAAVLDRLTLVINRGAADGVSIGDRFLIYGLGTEVFDPDTGRSLGQLEVVKGTGKVVHVQLRMATVSSDMKSQPVRTVRKSNPGLASILGGMEVQEEILPSERVPFEGVDIGDMVRKIR